MCFSAQADLIGGVVIAAIGIDALRHVGDRRDYLPLAALPLMFAAHQLMEAFVWWGLQGHVSETVGEIATWLYLLFAFVLLPIYVPTAVLVAEPPGPRRRIIRGFMVLGAVVSALLLAAMLRGPVTSSLADWHVRYGTGIDAAVLIVGAYILATCGSFIFSTNRVLVRFGVVNLVAVVVLAIFVIEGFASLWCAWAALASGAFALYLRSDVEGGESPANGIRPALSGPAVSGGE
jgi:hypothetical protein